MYVSPKSSRPGSTAISHSPDSTVKLVLLMSLGSRSAANVLALTVALAVKTNGAA